MGMTTIGAGSFPGKTDSAATAGPWPKRNDATMASPNSKDIHASYMCAKHRNTIGNGVALPVRDEIGFDGALEATYYTTAGVERRSHESAGGMRWSESYTGASVMWPCA